jgi:BRCT domain type II-containing protein
MNDVTGEVLIDGSEFVLTGDFNVQHEDIERLIRQLGGNVAIKVSSGTDYLVLGDRDKAACDSQAIKQAIELEQTGWVIETINEARLMIALRALLL